MHFATCFAFFVSKHTLVAGKVSVLLLDGLKLLIWTKRAASMAEDCRVCVAPLTCLHSAWNFVFPCQAFCYVFFKVLPRCVGCCTHILSFVDFSHSSERMCLTRFLLLLHLLDLGLLASKFSWLPWFIHLCFPCDFTGRLPLLVSYE